MGHISKELGLAFRLVLYLTYVQVTGITKSDSCGEVPKGLYVFFREVLTLCSGNSERASKGGRRRLPSAPALSADRSTGVAENARDRAPRVRRERGVSLGSRVA